MKYIILLFLLSFPVYAVNVKVEWSVDSGNNITAFQIFRSEIQGEVGESVAITGYVFEYIDNVESDKIYYYTIQVYKPEFGYLNESRSNEQVHDLMLPVKVKNLRIH